MMKIPGVEPKIEFDGEPFKVRFVEFPSAAKDAKIAKNVAFKLVKEAGPAREVKLGPRGVAQQPSEADWEKSAVFEVDLQTSNFKLQTSNLRAFHLFAKSRIGETDSERQYTNE